jgi:2,4-dienoyl-CoA reductase (NADPH2)
VTVQKSGFTGTVTPFPHLFSPLRLRNLTVRNRTVLLPMGSHLAREGQPTEGAIAFYRARAKGGVGLIITGGTPMHQSGALRGRFAYEAFNPDAIPAFARLVDQVHADGAAIFGQLYHRGRETLGDSDWPTWGPSAIPAPGDLQVPHAMTRSEVLEIIEAFGTSAANLRRAGYDGVEVHGAHGYLVAQFLSPAANRRDDEYGGSPDNRLRFLLEIVDSIRAAVDSECVLGVRISAQEGTDDGLSLKDSQRIVQALEATTKVDYVSITLGVSGTYVRDMSTPVGIAVPLAKAIREVSGMPLIVGQRINHPTLAEHAIASGAADAIGMARALIADWEWVNKAREGRLDEIRPCIACVQDCRSGRMACVHSPTAGREIEWGPGSLHPANERRKVVVVGGGPAGMEGAIQAAERGHEVVLFEAHDELGGQVRIASRAPNRAEIDGVIAYRIAELRRLGVTVRCATPVDADAVIAERPYAVILATGAIPIRPEIEGASLPHVIDVVQVQDPDASVESLLRSAKTAVVIDNGSGFWEVCSAAETLATLGLKVRFISPARVVGGNIPLEAIGPLYSRLRSSGTEFLPMHRASCILPGKVQVYDVIRLAATRQLEERELPADVVVCFAGKRAVDGLAEKLRGTDAQVHLVGDCVSPRRISNAVFEGHRIGRVL